MKRNLLIQAIFALCSIPLFSQNVIYVDINATGEDDGSSWNNAYTDLQTALSSASANSEVWIAEGKHYQLDTTRESSFSWTADSLKVLGGFQGGETSSDMRDPETYETIISGDINNDSILTNNSYTVITGPEGTNANPINYALIDGVTIQDGYSDNATSEIYKWGGGYYMKEYVNKIRFNNCLFTKNHAQGGGALAFNVSNTSEVEITNCIFDGNQGDYGNVLMTVVAGNGELDLNLTNNLITNQNTYNFVGTTIGSIFYLNARGPLNTSLNNNTITDNNIGTNLIQYYMGSEFTIMNLSLQNTILYNNGSATKLVTPYSSKGTITSLSYESCLSDIDEYTDTTSVTNPIYLDPQFVDAENGDYQLSETSPAIDFGSTTGITSLDKDINGNTRISNHSIDIGCYEFQQEQVGLNDFTTSKYFTIFPNPSNDIIRLNGDQNIDKIEAYDFIGNKVSESHNENFVDVSNLSKGNYLLKVYHEQIYSTYQISKF